MKPSCVATTMPLLTDAVNSSSRPASQASPRISLKKPKRPLTAYHIYFQIEREFIIQTMAGEDVDKTIHEGKTLFPDVPRRYRDTRLSPDWYFGPGKRAKRKHRKVHGKIGFLELSRVITSRWTMLDETDPDIKQFVTKLADQEMDEYKRELKEEAHQEQQKQPVATIAMEYKPTPPEANPVQVGQESDRFKNEFQYASRYQQRSFMWGERRSQDDFVDICDNDILSFSKSSNAEL